jgi:hypothetical protein
LRRKDYEIKGKVAVVTVSVISSLGKTRQGNYDYLYECSYENQPLQDRVGRYGL